MKIVQVVPSIESTGGPSYSVPMLCRSLAMLGHEVRLHVLGAAKPRPQEPFSIVFHPYLKVLASLGISPWMSKALRREAEQVDIIHNNGLWMMPNVYVGWAVKKQRCKLVLSPRGTLAEAAMKRSSHKKTLFWHSLQAQSLRRASCFHATSETELQDIRRAGFRQPVMLVPIPLNIPKAWQKERQPKRRLLYLGRLHPIKGINFLLEAWAAVQEQFPEWHLDLAGPDNDGYREVLEGMVRDLRLQRVSFLGPVFGADKDAAYGKAELYVLPTHSENFGVTVAEALARQVPAITTHGAPWSELRERRCGWWIPIGTAPLVDCLRDALRRPSEELHDMGLRGQTWIRDAFSLESVGSATAEAYRWLLRGGTPPPQIHCS